MASSQDDEASDDAPSDEEATTLSATAPTRLAAAQDPDGSRPGDLAATRVSPRGSGTARLRPGASSEPKAVAVGSSLASALVVTERYETRRVLGEGGMGEVRLSEDRVIGRNLAMKVIHKSQGLSAEVEQRFLREARVQGQLEHPAIVPVYDIGTLPNGELYFTMKRVSGETLEEALARIRAARDRGEPDPIPRRKLLAAFAQVCHAVAFAHARGVVHRDLKPANVMLGDFGEVYVLDWGIAKIEGGAEQTSQGTADLTGDPVGTQAGSLLGTPGYMAPEQARGEAHTVTARADIYALGIVLYEILTLAPFHRGRTTRDLVLSALRNAPASPRETAPEIAPELDAICTRATALDPDARFTVVRELREAIEAYLDGERDHQRRLEIADDHVRRADTLTQGDASDTGRADALRALGAAIALRPDHAGARAAIFRLLTDENARLPPQGEAELRAIGLQDRRKSALRAALSFVAVIGMLPLLFWMGIREAELMLAFFGLIGIEVGYLLWMWRTGNVEPRFARRAIWGAFVIVLLLTGTFGSLVVVPQAIVAVGATLAVTLRANRITLWWIGSAMVIVPLLPFVLSLLGILPQHYLFENDTIVIRSVATHLPPVPTIVTLTVATVFNALLVAQLLGEGVRRLIESERRNFAREYRLRALLPPE